MKRSFHPVRTVLLKLCHLLELGLSPIAPVWMPKAAEIVELKIVGGKGAKGLRLAQLSDLHGAAWLDDDYLQRLVEQVLQSNVRMAVWTGDFYLHSRKQLERCLSFFKEMHCKVPTFAVLGNHDFDLDSHETMRLLEASGMQVLRNDFVDDPIEGFQLRLLGLDDYHTTRSRFEASAYEVDANRFKLLLAHQPAFVRLLEPACVDLVLSGHLHGGQLHLPLVGAPYVPPPGGRWFIEHPTGEIQGNRYHINRGVGYSLLPIRIGAPPEITIIELT